MKYRRKIISTKKKFKLFKTNVDTFYLKGV